VPDAAYALTWLFLLNPLHGPVNIVLRALGLPAPAWLAHGDTALLSIVLMSLFQVGEGMVVLLAGLATIPADQYRAAAIDGAGRWQSFRWITLPMLAPWLVLLSLRDVILSAQSTFVPAYLMTGGGPYYATLFVPLHMYQEAFGSFRFGHAAAIMVLLLLAVLLLLVFLARAVRRPALEDDAA
jgi:multiple sugar transport system permease protein